MKNGNEIKKNEVIIFKPSTSTSEFKIVLDETNETVWASEQQIANLFSKDRSVISKHIKKIFVEGELNEKVVCAFFAHTTQHGAIKDKLQHKKIKYCNLDVIIAVGYRVKSPIATEFRKWATNILKDYLVQGFAINENELIKHKEKVKELEFKIDNLHENYHQQKTQFADGLIEIISKYAKSFNLLSKYDANDLSIENLSKTIIYTLNYNDVKEAIQSLKEELIKKGEATPLFGNEKDQSFKGILGSISQTAFGELAYPSIEEQATQLLYSIIKGHSFSDGNKRIGSFIFVWFLQQNNYHLNSKRQPKITENTLVTLSLAVAQSLPEQRETMVNLVINLIKEDEVTSK